MDIKALKNILNIEWNGQNKPSPLSPFRQLREFINFNDLDIDSKVYLCEILMKSSSPAIGSNILDNDMAWLLESIANDIFKESGGANRRISPLKTAFKLLALNISNIEVPALITPYLLAELEFQCRVRSKYLDYTGKLTRSLPKYIKKRHKSLNGIKTGKGRVNQIQFAYEILQYRNTTSLGIKLKELDKNLKLFYVASENGKYIKSRRGISGEFVKVIRISERLENTRNAIMHGEMNFISSEAYFYTLLLSIFFYYDLKAD